MSTNNSKARESLKEIFGNICMVEKAGIREIPESERKRIKGYKSSQETITYHHLKAKAKGGKADILNGSLVKLYNHLWINSLPPRKREEINNKIREFKLKLISLKYTDHGIEISEFSNMEINNSEEMIQIPLIPIEPKSKYGKAHSEFKRAKEKETLRKKVEEFYNNNDEYSNYKEFKKLKRKKICQIRKFKKQKCAYQLRISRKQKNVPKKSRNRRDELELSL